MITTASLAAPVPLRFSVSDSWAMPMVQLEGGQPTQGILYHQMQNLGCTVRNDPNVPVQKILRTLLRMKMSGEIDEIIKLYTGEASVNAPPD